MVETSTLCSRAMRRTSGEDRTRFDAPSLIATTVDP
jgi:hypothetical protein